VKEDLKKRHWDGPFGFVQPSTIFVTFQVLKRYINLFTSDILHPGGIRLLLSPLLVRFLPCVRHEGLRTTRYSYILAKVYKTTLPPLHQNRK